MSDSRARGFLEDIVANPDDDGPRLIYADWLEENGYAARAEFIRVQVERTTLPEWDARQVRLRLREEVLVREHGKRWKAELPRIEGVTWGEFRRGFVATANFASFATIKASAGECWDAAPIEAIQVRWPRQGEPCERLTPIAGLWELSLIENLMEPGEVDRIAASPLLSTVRALNARECSMGVDGFRRLVASPHLGNLTALRVPFNGIGNGAGGALRDAGTLNSLTELDLSDYGSYGRYYEDPILQSVGVLALTAWPGMAQVRSLTLSGNEVGQEGLATLLRSKRTAGLKELHLRGNGLDGRAMQAFESVNPDLQLDVLDLGENLLRDLGLAYMTGSPCLRELKVLNLERCELRQAAARRLAKAPFLNTLRMLNVNFNSFGPKGLLALLEGNPQNLHTLQMVANDLRDEGASLLAGHPGANMLREVNLVSNGLGDQGAQALGNSSHLQNLLALRLYGNAISQTATHALADSPLGKRLADLGIPGTDGDIPF
jgi:uncharacterized protein (TIGR02996 family)